MTVVAPMPAHVAWRSRDPEHEREPIGEGKAIDVYRPRYLSVSNRRVGKWNTVQIGLESFIRAVRGVLASRVVPRPEALYGHFLYLGGAAAVRVGHVMGIPAFPMVGEGLLNTMDPFGRERARRHFSAATAFMANSTCLARLLEKDLGVSRRRVGVFPNGIDHKAFRPRDRAAMREKLGLPRSAFLVICVSKQDQQKGPCRVGEAIQGLAGVNGMFLGAGTHPPRADNIVVNRPVPHDQVPEWLSAADVFVLPSTFEGCSNAVLEAMACGLPVVSSLGEFNDDILNPDVSIRTDPLDVAAIRQAITRLRDDRDLRGHMGQAALRWSQSFDHDVRARHMIEFITEHSGRPSHEEERE